MRTQEWFRTGEARAERVISDAQKNHHVELDTLFAALGEITDDPPGEDSAEILARALGCLDVRALRHLVHEARRAVEQRLSSGAHTIDARVQTLSESHRQRSDDDELETMTVKATREPAKYRDAGIIHLAVVFQALVWAIAVPPSKDPPFIVY